MARTRRTSAFASLLASAPDAVAAAVAAPLCVACGLGVDSVAMLVGLWRRGITPDLITFADVGQGQDEKPETYAYLTTLNAWLRSVGFPEVVVVHYADYAKHDRYRTLYENCIANGTLPSLAFGGKGCSLKFKVAVQNAYRARWAPARAAWARGARVTVAVGYDAGPSDGRRSKLRETKRYAYRYYLREWGWDREECKRQILSVGLPLPMKSSCYFCPSTTVEELAWLVDHHPELGDRIIALEANAKPRQDARRAAGKRAVTGLWRGGCKGTRGSVARPGDMTTFILARRAQKAAAAQAAAQTTVARAAGRVYLPVVAA